jgi:hypothetical protein
MPLTVKVLAARSKGAPAVAVVEWAIVDGAGAELFRRKQVYQQGIAEDGSAIAGETLAQLRARVLSSERAVRDVKLAEYAGQSIADAAADVEATGTDFSASFPL